MEPTRILDLENDGSAEHALAAQTALAGGNYVVERLLGQGGFGITYLAYDRALDREVVIKECFPESLCVRHGLNVAVRSAAHQAHFDKCVEMFMREARSIARLSHPNIVHVHSIFEDNATAYMVLDLIEGADLFDYIADPDSSLTPQEIHELAFKVLDALKVVHSENLLHRDISPDNILYSRRIGPTLIDFGSAREFASTRKKVNTTLLAVKDGYSPFEFYVSGAAHSPASDLYALGGTLYHLITGEAPPSSQGRHVAIQSGDGDPCVPLAGRFTAYHRAFLAAIDKAMSLAVAERIQSVDEWVGLIGQVQAAKSALVAQPVKQPKSAPKSLGDLVSETNKHLETGGFAEVAAPFVLQSPLDPAEEPTDWRDEFNLETLSLAAPAEEEGELDPEVPLGNPTNQEETAPSKPGWLTRLSGRSREMPDEDEIINIEEVALELYFEKNRAKKAKGNGIGFAGFVYLTLSVVMITLAGLLAINYDRMQEDGSWTVMFSLQGLCRNEELYIFMPVPVDCSERGEARLLDLNDRDRIMKFNTSDRIR